MFLVVANWKMNGSPELAKNYSQSVKHGNCTVVVCPPYHLISQLNGDFAKGAQNCHWADDGAYTGEVSAKMLAAVGASYVILGHSERRAMGETTEHVEIKAMAALNAGLTPIICIGEKEGENRDKVLLEQMPKTNCIIAYEPVWAIGSGRTPTMAEIEQAHDFIIKHSGRKVIYGGSVNANNAAEIAAISNVSGFLVGGASLNIDSFNKIIEAKR
jgi:triosephosphate isomerase